MRYAISLMLLLAASAVLAGPIDWLPTGEGSTIVGKPQAYDAKTVIDYMDGGAEIYFRYGFKQLYQATYRSEGQDMIVELYDMGSSRDAYGIFSTDLMGEDLHESIWQGARLQKGMLRAWRGCYFLKIVSMKTGNSFTYRAGAFANEILDNIEAKGPLPDLVTMLPKSLAPSNVHFSHAFEDFGAAYYISTENVLGLDEKEDAVVLVPKTDAVVADCKVGGKPVKGILIRYPSINRRNKAFSEFVSGFLRTKAKNGQAVADLGRTGFAGAQVMERGGRWMLALACEAKSAALCKSALAALVKGGAVGK